MPKITFELEVTAEEKAAFLERFSSRGSVVTDTVATTADAEEVGTPTTAAVDKNGVPWLEAVHASTKSQTKDGEWTRKKGVTAADKKAAEDAYKASNPTQPAAVDPVAQNFAASAMPGFPGTAPAAAPAMPGFPGTAPAMPGFPQPTAPVAPAPVSFEDITNKFAALQASGRLDVNRLQAFYQEAGSIDMNQYATDETLRSKLMAILNREYPG